MRVGWIWCFGWDVGNWLFGQAGLGMLLYIFLSLSVFGFIGSVAMMLCYVTWVVGSGRLASRFRPISHVSGCCRPVLRICLIDRLSGKTM